MEKCKQCYLRDSKPCYKCHLCLCGDDHFKPVPEPQRTNGDLFRAMSNEELAVTLMCPNEMGMADIPCDHSDSKNCCQCLLNWLNAPVAENAEEI